MYTELKELPMFERKSILAKLLAKENINVVRRGERTAAFDVVNRTLYLPMWKEMSNDLYDLLEGHEVGHALYTPAEGWHESVVDLGIPRALVNIIEDIRIERKILETYPGLKKNFMKGYQELLDRDFFGLSKRPVSSLGFIDRINVSSKTRGLVEVPFLDDESPLLNKAMAVETFEDVIEVCKEILDFLKEKNENKQSNTMPSEQEGEGSDEQDSGQTLDSGNPIEAPSSEESGRGQEEEETSSAGEASPEQDEKSGSEGQDSLPTQSEGNSEGDAPEDQLVDSLGAGDDWNDSYTDDAFRKNEESLAETGRWGDAPVVSQGIFADDIKDIIIPASDVIARRQKITQKALERGDSWDISAYEEIGQDFVDFMAETTKTANAMAKEFERKKAADQHNRSSEGKSGVIDVNKLHSYKFNDDLFLRHTITPDAKSHGLVSIIDFSGSMNQVVGNVVEQAITLAMFCRKVNLPFEIYSFTTNGSAYGEDLSKEGYEIRRENNSIDVRSLCIIQQLSSTMNKATFKTACETLYRATHKSKNAYFNSFCCELDSLGGTPLNETLIVMHDVLDNFKRKHNLQKVNFVAITDGDAQGTNCYDSYRSTFFKVQGKYIRTGDMYGRDFTEKLLENLRKKGYNCINYFIVSNSRDAKYKTYYCRNQDMLMKQFRQDKVVSIGDHHGYNEYFIIDGRQSATADEFEVKDNAKKGDIARAFKKFAKSKKGNKVLAKKFAEAIS